MAAQVVPAHASTAGLTPFRPGVVVVQVASGGDVGNLATVDGLQEVAQVSRSLTYEFAITDGTPVADEVTRLKADPRVISAEPDWILSVPEAAGVSMTADPMSIGAHPYYIQQMYLSQWPIPLIGLDAAHALSTGAGVTAAVIDTGVNADHPNLASRIVPGYDLLSGTTQVTDPSGGVDSGHGTFVAGLIAVSALDAKIMPVRVLDTNGRGDEIDVANGIYYAVDHGANVINLSLGSYADSAAVDAGVLYAEQHNVVVVAASGNDNTGTPEYPAATEDVVGVAATDALDNKAHFSNYGGYIALSAPGVDLYSTYGDNAYAFGAGTSFATALVSGIAALAWSAHPNLTADGVVGTLQTSSKNIDGLNPTYAQQLGAGRINALLSVGRSTAP
jgi:subtilisin family serine protease